MLSLERCRQVLGRLATNLSDEEVASLRDQMEAISDDLIEQLIRDDPSA